MKRKLIISRKGFDSSPQGGGGPSPILPDGTLLSLPIPSRDSVKYSDLEHPKFGKYSKIIKQLGLKPGRVGCHLDPDLNRSDLKRLSGWRPSLGQMGAAESHLTNQGVGPGDLFLFFGWFRHTSFDDKGKLIWSSEKKQDMHVLFGYLQIEKKVKPKHNSYPTWLEGHPHLEDSRFKSELNAIYIASKKLSLSPKLSGSGVFEFDEELVLTKPGLTRSWWSLPKRVFSKVDITYHQNPWKDKGFRCAGRGQEFVMPMTRKIEAWTLAKINAGVPTTFCGRTAQFRG